MKTFLTRLFIFLAVAFAGQYVLYVAIKGVLDNQSDFRFSRYFRDKKHANFVMGASRAVNSINEKYATENLKIDIINLGFNGQPYANMLDLLDDVNEHNKGSVIYVELSSLYYLEYDFDNQYAYYISNSKYVKKTFAGTVYDNISLLRLNNEMFLRSVYYLRKSDNDWLNRNDISESVVNEARNMKPIRLLTERDQFIRNLAEVQQKCDAAGNKLIYFLAPYLPAYRDKVIDFKDIVNIMETNRHKYRFIDLTNIDLPVDFYADRVHTNYKGAIKLTDSLMAMSKALN